VRGELNSNHTFYHPHPASPVKGEELIINSLPWWEEVKKVFSLIMFLKR
jgi:hypothetical protein